MIKNVLSDIGGVGLYGVVSISLFFAVFTGMLIWAFRMKKKFADSMSALPLDDGEIKSDVKGNSHE
jgi:cbb3-type cytochrome oxidase subunit 3